MADVYVRVHSDFKGDFDEQIDALRYAADALETYIAYIYGDMETQGRARQALVYAAARFSAAVWALQYDGTTGEQIMPELRTP